MTTDTVKLSAYLITLNEEAHLDEVLSSLAGADEILIVDSGSTDKTLAIAERHGARVIHQPWLGFARQKAFAMAQCRHDWVINLDGDEVLPPGGVEASSGLSSNTPISALPSTATTISWGPACALRR